MPVDPDAEREVLKSVARALQLVFELIPQPLGQRPAFPAINTPTAGGVVTASQLAPTALAVQVSSNRSDLVHYVDLLNADTFAVVDADKVVAFAGNNGTANITIPTQTAPGPTTYMLQCRVPTSVAGNIHRIYIDIQAPALPPPPTIVLSAMAAGVPLPAGTYPHATAGLNAVVATATTTGGAGPFTYHWSLALLGSPTTVLSTLTNTNTFDLIPAGTVYPTSAVISCYVTDSHGLNSPPVLLSYIIT